MPSRSSLDSKIIVHSIIIAKINLSCFIFTIYGGGRVQWAKDAEIIEQAQMCTNHKLDDCPIQVNCYYCHCYWEGRAIVKLHPL